MHQIHDAAPAVVLPVPMAAALAPGEQEVEECRGLSRETTIDAIQQREDKGQGASQGPWPMCRSAMPCDSVMMHACPESTLRFITTPIPLLTICHHHYRHTPGHISLCPGGVPSLTNRVQPMHSASEEAAVMMKEDGPHQRLTNPTDPYTYNTHSAAP